MTRPGMPLHRLGEPACPLREDIREINVQLEATTAIVARQTWPSGIVAASEQSSGRCAA